jgi:hypothetical protein
MGVYILGMWLETRHARGFTSIRIAGIRSWILEPLESWYVERAWLCLPRLQIYSSTLYRQ